VIKVEERQRGIYKGVLYPESKVQILRCSLNPEINKIKVIRRQD
jgi:hypothetical protein